MVDISKRTLKWISEEYYGMYKFLETIGLERINSHCADLNGSHYDTLETLPSALEFAQLVRVSRPALIRDCPVPKATTRWTDEYLAKQCGESLISVAVTPNGRADAITRGPDERLYFAEPHVEHMSMTEFLVRLSSGHDSQSTDSEVVYLQSQDGNLFSSTPDVESEFRALSSDVPKDLPFITEALDPYENIYSVIRGSKTFTVFPPTEGWCMEERIYPHATYERSPETSELTLVPSPSSGPPVRWSSIQDPTDTDSLPSEAHPIYITVNAGESLYLPAGWWHYVRQSEMTIAVNYWYDMESRGMSWVWLNLLRGGGKGNSPPPGNEGDEFVDSSDDEED
ncbi:hypothetical protein EW026_g5908 [Hermanssonia centrifuga]|uniref:JmjC domain-containing protein n=1 Tax=Hermanssonia centrifuga TaxID=98765 RepID=A0A4S4KCL2_9APHY|nr:hypothetical protein EW026_g5908 [Hermanssonia centrifuga]